jgi:predicted metal-dependent peptidase
MSRQTIGIDGETNGFLTDEEKRQIMSEIESISKANGEIKINKS